VLEYINTDTSVTIINGLAEKSIYKLLPEEFLIFLFSCDYNIKSIIPHYSKLMPKILFSIFSVVTQFINEV
jgi:hypothetical protein